MDPVFQDNQQQQLQQQQYEIDLQPIKKKKSQDKRGSSQPVITQNVLYNKETPEIQVDFNHSYKLQQQQNRKITRCIWNGPKFPTQLISVDQAGFLTIQDAADKKLLRSIQCTQSWILSVDVEKQEGIKIALGTLDNKIILFDNVINQEKKVKDFTQDKPQQILQSHIGPVYAVQFLSSNYLISGSGDSNVLIWDLENPQNPIGSHQVHNGDVQSLSIFEYDANIFLSGSADCTCKIWDIRAKNPVQHTFRGHSSAINATKFLPQNEPTTFATGSEDCTILLNDLRMEEPISQFQDVPEHMDGINSLAISKSGRFIFAGCDYKDVKAWDTLGQGNKATYLDVGIQNKNHVKWIDMSCDCWSLAVVGQNNEWSDEDSKPKDYIYIHQISRILNNGERFLEIKNPRKDMILKAKTSELRDQWIKYLTVLKDNMEEKTEIQSQNSEASDSENNTPTQNKPIQRAMSSANIQLNNASSNANGIKDKNRSSIFRNKKRKSIESDLLNVLSLNKEFLTNKSSNSLPTSQQLLEQTKILEKLQQKLDEKAINRRIIHGFLNKRKNKSIKQFDLRWFIIISAKPLKYEPNEKYVDEQIISKKDLPYDMLPDTLYYYKLNKQGNLENAEQPQKGFELIECIEVVPKDMSTSKEKGFTFTINTLKRLIHLMSDKETQRQEWMHAIQTSMMTAKELAKGGGQVQKNIDTILKTYDLQQNPELKKAQLQEKIDQDIKNIEQKVMEACSIKNPPRIDIIQVYGDYMHEIIIGILKDFWDRKYKSQQIFQILKLCNWLNTYNIQLQTFLKDSRLKNGIEILLSIYVHKQKENLEPRIDNLVEYEINNKACKQNSQIEDQPDLIQTETPKDIFKIINEIMDFTIKNINSKQSAVAICQLASFVLEYYHEQVNDYLEENQEIEKEQLIYISNNFYQFKFHIQETNQKLLLESPIDQSDLDKNFNEQNLIKNFENLAEFSTQIYQYQIIQDAQFHFHKKYYLDLDIAYILQEIISQNKEEMLSLHKDFQIKAWKSIIQYIIMIYFQNMILSCQKSKKTDDNTDFIKELKKDQPIIKNSFDFEPIDQEYLDEKLISFDYMVKFLTEENGFQIQHQCKKLRQSLGPAFTIKTIKMVMNIRKDLDKETKQEILQFCSETIEIYNKENKKELEENEAQQLQMIERGQTIQVLGEQEEDDDDDQTQQGNSQLRSSIYRKNTLSLENNNKTQPQSLFQSSIKSEINTERGLLETEESETQEQPIEGFLQKKKKGDKIYETRYFRIREGYLLWYKNPKAQECINRIHLQKAEDIYLGKKQNKPTFFIKLDNSIKKGKEYKIKAENIIERDKWVKQLKKELIKLHDQEESQHYEAIEVQDGKEPIIVDHEKQERIQKKQQKLKEKEKEKKPKINLNQSPLQNHSSITHKQSIIRINFEVEQNTSSIYDKKPNNKPLLKKEDEEDDEEEEGNTDCCSQLLICLGIKKSKKKQETTFK
ncbi:WD40-repeat-containing domain [Pseudocohnilembus persalinus]|uniref:WD40-repeat-containing domain n=1 Tax=Pseudocohnilembus persalinus TaxID=266149 RepID=A0A0V0QFU3_PSEPJ|nr:WD40-repeat-containing domain [Pseudocohnilembus persalinus]|eukprot:KRX01073.1 WD40-repeat-containing domain [Pseudocohnilembus persalinus]